MTTRLMAVMRDATAAANANASPPDESQLTLAAGYILTASIGVRPHIERTEKAILGPERRRLAAYTLHQEWANLQEREREERFGALRNDLMRLDPAFSELSSDQGRTKTAFAETVSQLGALGERSNKRLKKDRVQRELGREADARRHARPMSPSEIHACFNLADVISTAFDRESIHLTYSDQVSVPLHVAVLLRTTHPLELQRVASALYGAVNERDDLLKSLNALANEYQQQLSDEGKLDVAMQFRTLLTHRDARLGSLPFPVVQRALQDCRQMEPRGRGRRGPADVFARLLALAPLGSLGLTDMDPVKIKAVLQRDASAEKRRR